MLTGLVGEPDPTAFLPLPEQPTKACALSNCDLGETKDDGTNIATKEILGEDDETKPKDALVRVYVNLVTLTDFITSIPSTLLSSLLHTLGLFPMESNLTQILNIPLGTASSFVFKISLA